MNNLRIRKALAANMMRHWQLAKLMGISDMTLTRKLRNELPEEEQEKICELIEEYANGGKKDE